MKPRRRRAGTSETVRIGGRSYPVRDRLTIGRRSYLVLERVGEAGRERYMVFDPHAGPKGDLRAVLVLPRSEATVQHVRVLRRISANNINLPTIVEYRPQGDRLFVVLTWVSGPDLRSFLVDVRNDREPRPSAVEALRLVRGLAHGLTQLHRHRQIVHGDLKPANLVLAKQPSRLVMIDFGSAWTQERTKRRAAGDGIGFGYAAPELQGGAGLVDARSDQFAASVVLFELLTLTLPYDGLGGQAGRADLATAMRDKLVPPSHASADARKLPASLWSELDAVVMRGLALHPDERYPTDAAWLADLDRLHGAMRFGSRLQPSERRLTQVIGKWGAKLFGWE